ncbi:MAG: hypothetical protein D6753_13960 [Planctomycetota bacterium]|nr:MAG: hypothetical protein D6753_13960 [Planctomycetota bacterium]
MTWGWLLLVMACGGFSPLGARAQDSTRAQEASEGSSHRSVRIDAAQAIPFHRLNGPTGEQIRAVVRNPSFFRRMPAQQIECDPEMFDFLVRRPEIMVNIWDVMGITRVTTRRIGPDSFVANDGMGTTCRCDLVYGTPGLHIYLGTGQYDGALAPRRVTGHCVCVLRSQASVDAEGRQIMTGTMDVFLKLDTLGADLITRTVGPFIVKTADYNFVETARFIGEIYMLCRQSPYVAQVLAQRLDKIDPQVRQEFTRLAAAVSASNAAGNAAPAWRQEAEATVAFPYNQAPANQRHEQASDQDAIAAVPLSVDPTQASSSSSDGQAAGLLELSGASDAAHSAGSSPTASRPRVVPQKKLLLLRR